jgi:hypothetical protein
MRRYFRSKHLLSEFALNPEFVEWRGCILLKDGIDPERLSHWKSGDSTWMVETVINRRHITDLFINPPTAAPNELLFEVGSAVRDIWEAHLKTKFPERRIDVYFQYALPIVEITLYQVPEKKLR